MGVQTVSSTIWKHTITKQNKLVLSSWIPSQNCEKTIPVVHTLLSLRYFVIAAQQTNLQRQLKGWGKRKNGAFAAGLLCSSLQKQSCPVSNNFIRWTVSKWGDLRPKGPLQRDPPGQQLELLEKQFSDCFVTSSKLCSQLLTLTCFLEQDRTAKLSWGEALIN